MIFSLLIVSYIIILFVWCKMNNNAVKYEYVSNYECVYCNTFSFLSFFFFFVLGSTRLVTREV